MPQDLDRMLERLRGQPEPARLGRLEADLARMMTRPRAVAASPAWRSAVVSLALAAGLGIGSSAAALTGAGTPSHDFLNGARLAPSTLLGNSK